MSEAANGGGTERAYFLDDPRNRAIIFWALVVACAALLVADLWTGWWGRFCAIGFVSLTAIVFGAKGLRRIVMRDEDYHDR